MLSIQQILDVLYQQQACIFKPVSEQELRSLRLKIAKEKMLPIPLDYLPFLQVADGIVARDFYLFGVKSHERVEKNYVFPDLLTANKDFLLYKCEKKMFLLGEMDEDYLVYKDKTYQIIDKNTLQADFTCPNFIALIDFLNKITK